MNPNTNETPRTYMSGSLSITYPTYKDMYDNNIIFGYRGIVTSDFVTSVLDIMEERLEEERQSKKLAKKVFNVMVESLTNIYVDEDKRAKDDFDHTALLLVKRVNDAYRVTTGSYVPTRDVKALKHMLDKINCMTHDELKLYYQEILQLEDATASGLTSLAIIDLARKSKNKLVYNFKFESEKITFFTLESEISQKSL